LLSALKPSDHGNNETSGKNGVSYPHYDIALVRVTHANLGR
jgi:hypothetical protein